ncbi:MarR family transcriptional regulator [Novosphingobium sp. AAP83]|uniref:MarR family transcriptional regulator n=1 Tax=Novosphingobium sp. AAP83 TaxID=1523425 RepID=UPI000A9B1EC4|nr:MarR family transcriptional regulator [Novosphingobium sp. AAP83]
MTVRSMRATTTVQATPKAQATSKRGLVEPVTPVMAIDPATAARHLTIAREVYAERRRRHRFLPADLFGEPTWDILIDLYIAHREDRRVPTTSSCLGAHVPPTTALRWLRILESRALVEREDDGRDGRRTFVRLTLQGLAAMDATFASIYANFSRAIHIADTPPESE